jgi:hypothetical protein
VTEAPAAGWPGRVAVGVVRSDPPQIFIAPDAETLSRVIAVRLVARSGPADLDPGALDQVRSALLNKDWVEALTLWMLATGEAVDAYPDEDIVGLDDETASRELSVARVFEQGND